MCQQVRNCIIDLELEARDKHLKKTVSISPELKNTLPSLFRRVGRWIVSAGSILRREEAHDGHLASHPPFLRPYVS